MEFKRLPVILLFAVLITGMGSQYCLAGIAISPAVVELSLEKKTAGGKFVIRNTGNESERYRIMASHFVLAQNGSFKKVPPDKNSLVPWIKFNPKEFTLPPQSRRAVRFVVVPKGKAVLKKEYWCFMELQSLKEHTASATDEKGRTMKIKVVPAILVPIFASKGMLSYGASVEDIKIVHSKSDISIASLIKNTGNGHLLLDGKYKIINKSGNTVKNGTYGRNYILPGSQRELKATINDKLPAGEYTVKVEYSAPQLENPIRDAVQFTQ